MPLIDLQALHADDHPGSTLSMGIGMNTPLRIFTDDMQQSFATHEIKMMCCSCDASHDSCELVFVEIVT